MVFSVLETKYVPCSIWNWYESKLFMDLHINEFTIFYAKVEENNPFWNDYLLTFLILTAPFSGHLLRIEYKKREPQTTRTYLFLLH